MSAVPHAGTAGSVLEQQLAQRTRAGDRFFDERAQDIAALCHRMAERFARGGRLLAVGVSPAARSDVRHVTVEFVHPVIVGKRALPALGLVGEPVAEELRLVCEPEDIVIAFGDPEHALASGIAIARARGCLTLAFSGLGAEWELEPPSEDPFIRQEIVETVYHVLWELVHVFFEHRGLLEGRAEQRAHDAGSARFLYPFLEEREDDPAALLEDVRRSVLMKAEEIRELRTETLDAGAGALSAAATALRESFAHGGRLLALGNGGSATDAMDVVADFLAAGRPALDLTADTAVITAVANDIGVDAIFARQVIAHGRRGDVLLALSTSGNSPSVLAALAEARRRGLITVALAGYDGGRIVAERLADHAIVSPSQHIPRIQEAHATAYHLLRELVELE